MGDYQTSMRYEPVKLFYISYTFELIYITVYCYEKCFLTEDIETSGSFSKAVQN